MQSEHYKNLKDYYKDKDIVEFFLETDGCSLISLDNCLVLAYWCDIAKPYEVNPNGFDIYVQYATGSLECLVGLLGEDVRYVGFDRKGKLRVHALEHFKKIMLKYM